jgi:hypothetical protein
MKRLPWMSVGLLSLLTTAGCGSNRELQSVSLSPTSADARNFPNGQVRFVASGTFTNPPSPANLMSKDVFWCVGSSTGACVGNANPGANLDQNGVAQCNPGFVGTATILAGTQSSVMVNPDQGPQLKIFGSAQLTCP